MNTHKDAGTNGHGDIRESISFNRKFLLKALNANEHFGGEIGS